MLVSFTIVVRWFLTLTLQKGLVLKVFVFTP
jgi:hypothetical protein